jgi:hypothetical protein
VAGPFFCAKIHGLLFISLFEDVWVTRLRYRMLE